MSPARRRSRLPRARTAALLLAFVGVFLAGVALGAALEQGPEPAATTYERTLRFATVTVTATAP